LHTAKSDRIELTNGCVCCAMTGDLFFAIGDMLDRRPRPDHLIVEASGIADPAKIAMVARTEPELLYGGILTVVDGENFASHLGEARISDQVRSQVRCADFLAVSKVPVPDAPTRTALQDLGVSHWLQSEDTHALTALLGARPEPPRAAAAAVPHPDYVTWASEHPSPVSKPELTARLVQPPRGLLRVKGLLPSSDGGFWEVHLVGTTFDIAHRQEADAPGLVVIGLDGLVTPDEIAHWWDGSAGGAPGHGP
jgi:G3E family GTPase